MASKLSKQLEGAQQFLRSTMILPNFDQLKARQLEHVLKQVGCASYSTEYANHLLNVWDSSIWGNDATASFQAAVAERTGIAVELNKARRALQNYVAIPKYLTQPLWDTLRSQVASDVKLEKLFSHASRSAVSVGRHRGHVVDVEFRFSAGAHGKREIAVGGYRLETYVEVLPQDLMTEEPMLQA